MDSPIFVPDGRNELCRQEVYYGKRITQKK